MERWPKDVLITTLVTASLIGISYIFQQSEINLKTAVGTSAALVAILFVQVGMMPFVRLQWKVYPFYISIFYISAFLGSELGFDPNYMYMACAIPLSAFVLYGYNIKPDVVWEKKYTIGLIGFIFLALCYANAI